MENPRKTFSLVLLVLVWSCHECRLWSNFFKKDCYCLIIWLINLLSFSRSIDLSVLWYLSLPLCFLFLSLSFSPLLFSSDSHWNHMTIYLFIHHKIRISYSDCLWSGFHSRLWRCHWILSGGTYHFFFLGSHCRHSNLASLAPVYFSQCQSRQLPGF